MGSFEKAATGLKKLSNRNTIPYQNIKNKKTLYTYITKTVEETLEFYKRSSTQTKEIDSFPKVLFEKVS